MPCSVPVHDTSLLDRGHFKNGFVTRVHHVHLKNGFATHVSKQTSAEVLTGVTFTFIIRALNVSRIIKMELITS